jgi:hypothetical protein
MPTNSFNKLTAGFSCAFAVFISAFVLTLGVRAVAEEAPSSVDFKMQGEYLGELELEDGKQRIGVQVIALGSNRFKAVGYPGGLPGEGWTGGDQHEADGRLVGKVVEFRGDEGMQANLSDGTITVKTGDNRTLGELRKTERKSSTLGAKPPEGAVVLFDGTSADKFEGGRIEDGLLVQGCTSKQKFQSCTVHLEFRTPFMPEALGQARGNSGCYLQGRYEVQILDSFGLAGENNECGGIYTIAKPRLNMCYPPYSWQTYDIEYVAAQYDGGKKVKNATISVKHNDVTIHDKVQLTHATTAAPLGEGPEPGPLYLQDHGNPVRYRNVWVLEKK